MRAKLGIVAAAALAAAGCDGPARPGGPIDVGPEPTPSLSITTDSAIDRLRLAGAGLPVRIAGVHLPHPALLVLRARSVEDTVPFYAAQHPVSDSTLVVEYTLRATAQAIGDSPRILLRASVNGGTTVVAESVSVRIR